MFRQAAVDAMLPVVFFVAVL